MKSLTFHFLKREFVIDIGKDNMLPFTMFFIGLSDIGHWVFNVRVGRYEFMFQWYKKQEVII